jgi:hypothetical protein
MQSRTYEVTLAVGGDATKPNSSSGDEQRNAASQMMPSGESSPPLMPYRRAIVIGDMPGSRLSEAISRFCSMDHRRRLSPRVITLVYGIAGSPGML